MKYLKSITLLLLAIALVACGSAETEPAAPDTAVEPLSSDPISVSNVRANMTLPTDTGSFWMLISNNTETDDALTGAEVAGCGVIELHDMIMEDNVMKMQQVEGGEIIIPAGETVELKQGGLHVMCIQKEAPLTEGETLPLTLQFANAGPLEVTATVVKPDGMMNHGDMDHGDGDMDHGDMDMDHSDGDGDMNHDSDE